MLHGRLYEVTPPPAEPVTLAEIKDWIQIDSSDRDAQITMMIKRVRQALDGRDGWLNRALVQLTWDYKLATFFPRIELPLPPLRSVDSITYLDSNGASQTLSTDIYDTHGVGSTQPGWVQPKWGESWPTTYDVPEAVTVRFSAGYDDDGASSPDYGANVPDPIKWAFALVIRRELENPSGMEDPMLTKTEESILAPYRVHTFA